MFYAGETQSNNWFMAQSNNTIDFTRWIDLPPSKYVVRHRYAIIYNSKYDSDSVFNSSRGITTAVAISSSFTSSTSPKTCQNRLLKTGYLNEAPCGACTVNLRLFAAAFPTLVMSITLSFSVQWEFWKSVCWEQIMQ